MVPAVDTASAGVLVALIALGTPLLTYLGLRRTKSGRVNATDAETLWAEAERMRQIYRDEAASLRVEGMAMREEVLELRREVITLRAEAVDLRAQLTHVEAAATRKASDAPPP